MNCEVHFSLYNLVSVLICFVLKSFLLYTFPKSLGFANLKNGIIFDNFAPNIKANLPDKRLNNNWDEVGIKIA